MKEQTHLYFMVFRLVKLKGNFQVYIWTFSALQEFSVPKLKHLYWNTKESESNTTAPRLSSIKDKIVHKSTLIQCY